MFKVVRDAEIEIDDEADDLIGQFMLKEYGWLKLFIIDM